MKMYVLVISWNWHSGDCGEYVHVYDSLEKAQKQMSYEVKLARQDFKQYGIVSVEDTYDKGSMCWTIQDKLDSSNHCEVVIYNKEVE